MSEFSQKFWQATTARLFAAKDSAVFGDGRAAAEDQEVTALLIADSQIGQPLPDVLAVMPLKSCEIKHFVETENLLTQRGLGTPLLLTQSCGSFLRPSLRGSRLSVQSSENGDDAGITHNFAQDSDHAWSPEFLVTAIEQNDDALTYHSTDQGAGLQLTTEIRALIGGSLAIRHILTNHAQAAAPYALEALEVRLPLAAHYSEVFDFTGRHEHERDLQRLPINDGMWLRETRSGKPDFPGSLIIAGTREVSTQNGEVLLVQPMWSGNTLVGYDRSAEEGGGIFAGELLLPGEIVLQPGSLIAARG
ncbi:glycoside hydrolase family 36 N-terminal domain-containing protein [Arcanobacterium hippocoleae]|uniref:glycoside hydrolase family 36 N-terminal domain-containing protein n=1 Tax=Arcanobacterium hippocoleae TaxID=149017 RepID=UPI003340498F